MVNAATFDPAKFGPVLTPIWESINEQLADGEWRPLAEVRDEAVERCRANVKTVDNLIRSARKAKLIAWRGGYSHKLRKDTREIALCS